MEEGSLMKDNNELEYNGNAEVSGISGGINDNAEEQETVPAPMTYRDIKAAEAEENKVGSNAVRSDEGGSPVYSISEDELILPPFSEKRISKKVYIIKSLAWMLSVVLVSLAIFMIFRFITAENAAHDKKTSVSIPDNHYAASSYAEEVSLAGAPAAHADPDGPQISTVKPEESTDTNEINRAFKKASPSVVCVTSYKSGQDYILNKIGDGSGIIISADGYIATNSHVVDDDTSTGVLITVYDGTQYLGTIIGVDPKTDLAVIKIDAEGLTPAEFANSDTLYVGQEVYAIGNPGGSNFTNSLTKGTVSAVGRILSSNAYVRYIQTDAAINPGNSGGPLVNEHGQVVGMNTSKIVTANYEGMGFSIPCNKVAEIINKLIRYGYINDRGTLGILGTTCNLYESKSKNVPMGMVITKIDTTSPLYMSKVKEQDIITAVNGVRVKSAVEFIEQMSSYKPGDTIVLTLFRAAEGNSVKEYSYDQQVTLIEDTASIN